MAQNLFPASLELHTNIFFALFPTFESINQSIKEDGQRECEDGAERHVMSAALGTC